MPTRTRKIKAISIRYALFISSSLKGNLSSNNLQASSRYGPFSHPEEKILFAFCKADESEEGPSQKRRVEEAEGGVGPSAVEDIHGKTEKPMKEQGILKKNIERGRGGSSDDFRRATERNLSPRDRLVERFDDATQIYRNEHQVQCINPKEIAPAIAAPDQIPPIKKKVGKGGDRKPETSNASLKRKRQKNQKPDIDRRNRD